MIARAISLVLAFVGSMFGGDALAAGPFGTIHVGNWIGGAYTDDKTGAFSHCAAATAYVNGANIAIGQNVSGAWLISFGYQSWQLAPGETFPIDLTFDGQAQFHLFGTALTPASVNAILPSQAILGEFRKSHLMAVVAKGQTFQFNLTSTGPLLPVISNCVAKTKAGGLSSAGDFSILSTTAAKPQQAAAGPPATRPPAGKQSQKPAKTDDVSGTGFAVSANGYVVTNYHVISECVGDISGSLTRQAALPLRVVSTDETNDLALLQAPPGRFRQPATIRSTTIHPGDAVIAIGFPYHGLLTSDFTVTTGSVSSLSGILNDTRYLQISAPVQPGNSGGPLLDTSGAVVGVVAAKLDALKFAKLSGGDLPENINFAIKTGAVRDFLDNGVVPYSTVESGPELKAADIAANARTFTMLISCTAAEKE